LLILLLIIAAFLLGALVTKVTWLQDKVTGGTSAGVTPGQQQQAVAVKPLHVAQSIGMDADKFKKCLDSGKYTREVAKDLADGQAGGVTGTPAVFVNGLLIVGAQPYSVFKTQIDKELASARTFDTLFQQLGNALTQKA